MTNNNYATGRTAIFLHKHRRYLEKRCREGLSYSELVESLKEQYDVGVLRGSIHYFFEKNPALRRIWKTGRTRRIARQEYEDALLKIQINQAIKTRARTDKAFRRMLEYFGAHPSARASFGQIYRVFKLIDERAHLCGIVEKTGATPYTVRNCTKLYGITLPDGRQIINAKYIITPAQEKAILECAKQHGIKRTARLMETGELAVERIVKKHGVKIPVLRGRPSLERRVQEIAKNGATRI